MPKEYHPFVVWDTMQTAAHREDYLMVSLCALILVFSPIVYPALCLLYGVGIGVAKVVNRRDTAD